jgi:hypothetical protein
VTLSRQTSSTRIAKHRSFIELKFLQNFCSSCKTLADQVARNPRFCCTWKVARCLFSLSADGNHDKFRIFLFRFSRSNSCACVQMHGITTLANLVEWKEKEIQTHYNDTYHISSYSYPPLSSSNPNLNFPLFSPTKSGYQQLTLSINVFHMFLMFLVPLSCSDLFPPYHLFLYLYLVTSSLSTQSNPLPI